MITRTWLGFWIQQLLMVHHDQDHAWFSIICCCCCYCCFCCNCEEKNKIKLLNSFCTFFFFSIINFTVIIYLKWKIILTLITPLIALCLSVKSYFLNLDFPFLVLTWALKIPPAPFLCPRITRPMMKCLCLGRKKKNTRTNSQFDRNWICWVKLWVKQLLNRRLVGWLFDSWQFLCFCSGSKGWSFPASIIVYSML